MIIFVAPLKRMSDLQTGRSCVDYRVFLFLPRGLLVVRYSDNRWR
jgi:hypothetical protein